MRPTWWSARDVYEHPEQIWNPASRADPRDRVLAFHPIRTEAEEDCYVAELAHGKVIDDATLVATARNNVLGNLQVLYGYENPREHPYPRRRRFRFSRSVRGTVSLLAASNGDNYYHWLFDSLPRLRLLELAGTRLNAIDGFVLNLSHPSFQIQSLRHFGIPFTQLLYPSRLAILQPDRLIVPSMPGSPGSPPKWVCDWLREKFLPRSRPHPNRKIYISRRRARGRRICNESELEPLLARHGYEIIDAEHLSFDEQVSLFSSAASVIAPHGAGLSNLVWCHPGTTVLELQSPTHAERCFQVVAEHGGLRYAAAMLEPAPGDTFHNRFTDLVADPQALARALDTLA